MSKRSRKKQNLEELKKRSIALGSGKGGVGKSTTAVNLAAFFAMKDFRVGLVDLDPLSDIAVILDMDEQEGAARSGPETESHGSLDSHVLHAFDNLDLLFPRSKLSPRERGALGEYLFDRYTEDLVKLYDILIFDLPAGSRIEDNIAYLHHVHHLIVVTNPEPTAHVSAGAYIKSVLDESVDVQISLWHNRYRPSSGDQFDSRDVIGNYNRNVSEEVRIDDKKAKAIEHLAFIPDDPSLDLLQGNVPLHINVQQSLRDALDIIQRELLSEQLMLLGVQGRALELMLFLLTGSKSGWEAMPEQVASSLQRLDRENSMRQRVLRLIGALSRVIDAQLEAKRPFAALRNLGTSKALDREVSLLLMDMSKKLNQLPQFLRNTAGILLFTFSLYKLFQSKSIVNLVDGVVPKRKDPRGVLVRDRHYQIRCLVERDAEYRKKYFSLVKVLFPVLLKQISTIVKTFDLRNLLLRNDADAVNREAYLKLLINFLHDLVYSGLSIIVGFRYRPASVTFQQKAGDLLAGMPAPSPQ